MPSTQPYSLRARRYGGSPRIFAAVVIAQLLTGPALSAERLTQTQCLAELDAAVYLSSNEPDQADALSKLFAQLEMRCDHLPQLAHNQGVLAANAGQWPEAARHFERSLQQDPRAAMTQQHLRQMHEYRAAKAYASALGTPDEHTMPQFMLQNSKHVNALTRNPAQLHSRLHSISTLEYELYAWWQALQNKAGLEDHYVDGHPSLAIELSRKRFANRKWDDMQREIAFTAQDAVVIVSDPYTEKTLLLLRLVGNRWKIYQETTL